MGHRAGWEGAEHPAQTGQAARAGAAAVLGAGGAHSRLAQCPPALGAVAVGPHGRCPSWLCASPVLHWTCCSAGHSGGPHRECSWGLARWHFAPARFPPRRFLCHLRGGDQPFLPSPCLLALPGSRRRCPGSPQRPRPCCSSGLALGFTLLLGDRDVPALPAIPAQHFPCRSTVPSLCHVLRPSIMFF